MKTNQVIYGLVGIVILSILLFAVYKYMNSSGKNPVPSTSTTPSITVNRNTYYQTPTNTTTPTSEELNAQLIRTINRSKSTI